MSDTDLSETRRRLDDLIRFAGEVHEAACAARDAMDANKPFIIPKPIDLTARLASYHTATEDVPRNVVCAVLEAMVRPDLSKTKQLLSDLRNELILAEATENRFEDGVYGMAMSNVLSILSELCGLIAAESAWPQQPARRRREQLFTGTPSNSWEAES